MSKFKSGDEVYLFNSMSMAIERDTVYCTLQVPMAVEGVEQRVDAPLKERLERGEMEVVEQCQTLQHQIVDADRLFASESECVEFYKAFFGKK